MRAFVPHSFELAMSFDEANFRYPDNIPSTVSGDLRLHGPPSALVLGGDVDVVRLRYAENLDPENMFKDLKRRNVEARGFEKRDEFLRFDVNVHVGGDARIDNNLVRMALRGDLKIVGTNAHMGVLGSLTGLEGGRAFFRGNEFVLRRVTVDLTDRDRIAPFIDLQAESVVRDYKVFVHAYGPAEDPQVDLTSEPDLVRSDVVTLLTLGITRDDPDSYTAGAGAGLVGETLLSISGLDKQVKKFIPKNTILRDFGFNISTQYSEVSRMVEPTAHFESRVFTDSFKVRLSQPVISGRGRRAQAEYKINKHVSAQAQYDNENRDFAFDLGLDLRLRWELD
jgi:translocation and assembly module TamB